MTEGLSITLDKEQFGKLEAIIAEFGKVDQKPPIAVALKRGMQLITSEGKSNLLSRNQTRTGNLKSSIGVSVNKKAKASYGGFKRPKGAAAHLVDRGTADRWTKDGRYRGKVTGTEFFTDAVYSMGDDAVNTVFDTLYEELDKIASK